jgi:hypothetical protein
VNDVAIKPRRKPRKLPDVDDEEAVKAWVNRILFAEFMRLIEANPQVTHIHVDVDVVT